MNNKGVLTTTGQRWLVKPPPILTLRGHFCGADYLDLPPSPILSVVIQAGGTSTFTSALVAFAQLTKSLRAASIGRRPS